MAFVIQQPASEQLMTKALFRTRASAQLWLRQRRYDKALDAYIRQVAPRTKKLRKSPGAIRIEFVEGRRRVNFRLRKR